MTFPAASVERRGFHSLLHFCESESRSVSSLIDVGVNFRVDRHSIIRQDSLRLNNRQRRIVVAEEEVVVELGLEDLVASVVCHF